MHKVVTVANNNFKYELVKRQPMKYKFKILYFIVILLATFIIANILTLSDGVMGITNKVSAKAISNSEIKRGDPPYDYLIGKDKLPHFRVFFWVPLSAAEYLPYADKDINTDVSHHGPIEKWSVLETGIKNDNEKLVCIVVPKTFVLLHGKNFYKVIYLSWH
jgi:hypothetical protein